MDIIKKTLENTQSRNCLKKNCPVRGAWLMGNVLYCAKISFEGEKYKSKLYKGICETTFRKP